MKKVLRRDDPRRQVEELVRYFRGAGDEHGRDGDYHDRTPAESAVHTMRKLQAQVKKLEWELYLERRKTTRHNNQQQWTEKLLMKRVEKGLQETSFPSAFMGLSFISKQNKRKMVVLVVKGKRPQDIENYSPSIAEVFASRLMRAAAEARVSKPTEAP